MHGLHCLALGLIVLPVDQGGLIRRPAPTCHSPTHWSVRRPGAAHCLHFAQIQGVRHMS